MKKKKVLMLLILGIAFIPVLSGCSESERQSHNMQKEADNFNVLRKLTFINTITNQELFVVEGNFSINFVPERNQLEIIAKTGENEYQKHYLGVSPTTVYICEQTEWKEENKYGFKIILNPVVPDITVN